VLIWKSHQRKTHQLRNCKLVLQEKILIFFSESLTSKNSCFELVNTCTALNASRVSSVSVGREAVGKSMLYACTWLCSICLCKWEYPGTGFVVLCVSVFAVFHTSLPLFSLWLNYLIPVGLSRLHCRHHGCASHPSLPPSLPPKISGISLHFM